MAFRHWVGGSGTWDGTNTANWASFTGGPGGASVPTSSDIVVIDSLSGSGTITASGQTVSLCGGLLFASSTIQLAGTLATYAGMTIGSNVTWGTAGIFLSGSGNVQTNGVAITGTIVVDAGSGTVSLSGALNTSNAILIYSGTFNTNNYTVTCAAMQPGTSGVKTINFGTSTVNFTGSFGFGAGTNLTTTGQWTANFVLSGGTGTINGGTGFTYYDLCISGNGALQTNGNISFNRIYNVPNGSAQSFRPRRLQTVTCNELSLNGYPGAPFTLACELAGTRATIYLNSGSFNGDYLVLKDNNATGGAGVTFRAGPFSVNNGNISGWSFADTVNGNFFQFFKNPI